LKKQIEIKLKIIFVNKVWGEKGTCNSIKIGLLRRKRIKKNRRNEARKCLTPNERNGCEPGSKKE